MLILTESAKNAVSRFIKNSETAVQGLRVSVSDGGCSGLQYGMMLEANPAVDDKVLDLGEIKVFIDPESFPVLDGVTVDFLDSMEGSGFKFDNPNATKSCGCGKSFSC
jgi:iron-sulfur cluster assembly protein